MIQFLFRRPLMTAFLLAMILAFFNFPYFFFLQLHPMGQLTWELQDPVVSFMTFIPGHKVLTYELYHHGQILWSNLRSFGMPILGNDIQAAPLFPLTLLLSWIPLKYFWTIKILCLLILSGAGAYLLAHRCMKLPPVASLVFVVGFTYSLFLVRWVNHPYFSGITAGIWYLYFLSRMMENSANSDAKQRFYSILGTTISLYSLITCGFPEAAIVTAVMALLTQLPLFLSAIKTHPSGWFMRYLRDLFLSHGFGLLLSSMQLFSLMEMLQLLDPDFRGQVSRNRFPTVELLLQMVTHFSKEGNPPILLIHLFGEISVLLFLVGCFKSLVLIRRWTPWNLSAFLVCGFYVLVAFPLWPPFNEFITHVPAVGKTVFSLYGFASFLFGFIYFVAQGFNYLVYEFNYQTILSRIKTIGMMGLASIIVGWMVFWNLDQQETDFYDLVSESIRAQELLLTTIGFFIFLFIHLVLPLRYRIKKASWFLIGGMMVMILYQSFFLRPHLFYEQNGFHTQFVAPDLFVENLLELLDRKKIPLQEIRYDDPYGRYSSEGLATPDNGAAAIIPERLRLFKTQLFKTSWDGYMPFEGKKVMFATQLASHNLYTDSQLKVFQIDPETLDDLGSVQNGIKLYYDPHALSRAYLASNCISSPRIKNAVYNLRLLGGPFPKNTIPKSPLKRDPSSVGTYFPVSNPGFPLLTNDVQTAQLKENSDLNTFGLTPYSSLKPLGVPHHFWNTIFKPLKPIPRPSFRKGIVSMEELSPEETDFCRGMTRPVEAVPIIKDEGSIVTLSSVKGPGLLVLNDQYYPGWKAYDQKTGTLLPIRPANVAFRGVFLQEHRDYAIVFKYRPWWLPASLLLILIAIIGLAGLTWFSLKRKTTRR